MNTQTIKQEDLRRAMAKQTLGLPLTGRENSLITLFGQSSTYERENKPVSETACCGIANWYCKRCLS